MMCEMYSSRVSGSAVSLAEGVQLVVNGAVSAEMCKSEE